MKGIIILTKGRCKGKFLVYEDVNVENAKTILNDIDEFSVKLLDDGMSFSCEGIRFLKTDQFTITAIPE